MREFGGGIATARALGPHDRPHGSSLAQPAKLATLPAMPPAPPALRLFIDADACPVKDEAYRVAARYELKVTVVANSPILAPRAPDIERVVVAAGPDVADDRRAGWAGSDRRHRGHSAGEPLREGWRGGDRADG